MAEPTPQLNPAELYDKRKSKDSSRLRAYNKILEQVYNRIRVMSLLPNSQCYLLYTVPPFILGLPKIDLEDCVVYLIYQLRHAKYDVRYTPPNMLYISWVHHEKSYLMEQSPIMQSMLESAEKTAAEIERKEKEASRLLAPRKSGKKVQIQTPGFSQQPYGQAQHGYGQAQPPYGQAQQPYGQAQQPYGQAQHGYSQMQPLKSAMRSGPSRSAINTVLNRPLSNPTAGPPPPSAADYVPPSSFLQNMTHPQNTIVQPKSVPDYFNR